MEPKSAPTESAANPGAASPPAASAPRPPGKRPAPGQRRLDILQALATMLERPGAERVTTAALAQQLGVSEAALYRHFASKAQMFEGLIDFIESSVFGLVQQISDREPDPLRQVQRILAAVLQFAEQNPGLARVMVGDALVLEHERLTRRMNLFFDKLESAVKQRLREAEIPDSNHSASLLLAFLEGRMKRYVRTGFKSSTALDFMSNFIDHLSQVRP